jgi:glycosyltransferase involved in cell wall biosynthesis
VGVVAAAHEDYGLTPLEGASFGKPAAVLEWGGFLDTVVEGETGLFFPQATPELVADTIKRMGRLTWSDVAIADHAARFGAQAFADRLRQVVDEVLAGR